jgi:hypothetical protein
MTAKKQPPLKDADGNAIDPEVGGVTPADPDAPTASAPPASADPDAIQSAPSPLDASIPAAADTSAVTMADVAALNGIGLAPDESDPRLLGKDDEKPFISAGMAYDLETYGWAVDPATGKKIVKE